MRTAAGHSSGSRIGPISVAGCPLARTPGRVDRTSVVVRIRVAVPCRISAGRSARRHSRSVPLRAPARAWSARSRNNARRRNRVRNLARRRARRRNLARRRSLARNLVRSRGPNARHRPRVKPAPSRGIAVTAVERRNAAAVATDS